MFSSTGAQMRLAAIILIALALIAVSARLTANDFRQASEEDPAQAMIEAHRSNAVVAESTVRRLPPVASPGSSLVFSPTRAIEFEGQASLRARSMADNLRETSVAAQQPARSEVLLLPVPGELVNQAAEEPNTLASQPQVTHDASGSTSFEPDNLEPSTMTLFDRMLSSHVRSEAAAREPLAAGRFETPCGMVLPSQQSEVTVIQESDVAVAAYEPESSNLSSRVSNHGIEEQPNETQQVAYLAEDEKKHERTPAVRAAKVMPTVHASTAPILEAPVPPVPPRDLPNPHGELSRVVVEPIHPLEQTRPPVEESRSYVSSSIPQESEQIHDHTTHVETVTHGPSCHAGVWHTRIKPWLEASHWGYPEEFQEPPLGRFVVAHMNRQVVKGEAARMVLYNYDFVPGEEDGEHSAVLNRQGERQLRKIAVMMQYNPAPLVIQHSEDPGLDQERRTAIIEQLAQLGSEVSPDRVVIADPTAIGLPGPVAIDIYGKYRGSIGAEPSISSDTDSSNNQQQQ